MKDLAWLYSGSCAFGEFGISPLAAFAPVFAKWALLMHSEADDGRLSTTVSDKSRASECEPDALRASLVLDNPEEQHQFGSLKVDGYLIEWKR
jgi:hypothetical protein